VKIEREGEGYAKAGQVSLLFSHQETRRIKVMGASVVADTARGIHRELLLSLGELA
jgi:hypothetical protein